MSKARVFSLAGGLLALLFVLSLAQAAIPRSVHVQAFLADSAGAAVTGPRTLKFCLYTVPSGGIAQWCDTRGVTVTQGVFDVALDESTTPFPPGLFDTPLYLGLNVGGDGEMSPRITLTSEAYAFKADDADTVGGQTAASLDQSSHVTDQSNPHQVTAAQVGAASPSYVASAITTHAGDPSAHHAKTTSFTELTDTISDMQIPPGIARDTEIMTTVTANDGPGSGLDADLLDGLDSTAFAASIHNHDTDYVNISGDAMTGALVAPSLTVNTSVSLPGAQTHTASVDSNTRLGVDAGAALDSTVQAKGNVAIGNLALNANALEGNTALGFGSLQLNRGLDNTAVGAFAGMKTLGSNNVFLGFAAGQNETGSNKLYIANNATTPLIYGDFVQGRVGIGLMNPSVTLDVNGSIHGQSISGNGAGLTGIQGAGVIPDFGAQDIRTSGHLLVNELTPKALLSVNGDAVFTGPGPLWDNLLFSYKANPASPLGTSGPGGRMFWHPGKAAFRVGLIDSRGTSSGTQWDDANIGVFSFAAGYNPIATGYGSIAMGSGASAYSWYGIALGHGSVSSSPGDIAIGDGARALNGGDIAIGGGVTAEGGGSSIALGAGIDVKGVSAVAIGHDLTAPSYGETVIGLYNTSYTPANSHAWSAGDRLFTIGNGTFGTGNESDALVVLKNGRTGLGTSRPKGLLHVEGDVLLQGTTPSYDTGSGVWTLPAGDVPVTGLGGRVIWYPRKAAFRAGMLDATVSGVGDEWNDANTGLFSVALGENTKASGKASLATGAQSVANGDYATALGRSNQASGPSATALGQQNIASGDISTAMGSLTAASGRYSLAAGLGTRAPSRSETVFGEFNTVYTPFGGATNWDDRDRLFVIGNGVSGGEHDAFVVLKNGKVGIGVSSPARALDIASSGSGTIGIDFGSNQNAGITFSEAGTARWIFPFFRGWQSDDLIVRDEASLRDVMTFEAGTGRVGINTGHTTMTHTLVVNGTASKPGGGTWAVFSDERLKDIGGDYEVGLAEVMRLQPVTFHYKTDNPLDLPSQSAYVGFSAQALQRVIPQAVSKAEAGYLEVDIDPVLWAMLNAIKDLKREKDDEMARLTAEKDTEIAALKAANERLQAHMERLDGQFQFLVRALSSGPVLASELIER